MKNKIDPRHAELFEEMFGANAKGENVEIPTEYQKQIEKASAPLPLRYIDAFFTLLINIICKFIPIILIFGLVLNDVIKNDYNYFGFKNIFNFVFHEFAIFYPVLFFAAFSWVALQLLDYAFQALVVLFYSINLNFSVKKYQKYDRAIKQRLHELDSKDKKELSDEEKAFLDKFSDKLKKDTEESKEEKKQTTDDLDKSAHLSNSRFQ